MKTRKIARSVCFLCSFFLVLLLGALAYGQTIDSITVTPTTPSTDDEIVIQVSGTVTNTCYEVTTSAAGMESCGVEVSFLMTKKSGCFSFPGDPAGWKKTAHVDEPLPEGIYMIAAELRNADNTLLDSMTTSFFVLDYSDITEVQIVQIRSSMLTTLHVDDPLRLMIDAIGPEGTTIQYQFFYRFGYGTPAWDVNSWELEQDWSTSNSVVYTFAEPGTYYVIGHVRAAGTEWSTGDQQGGFVVDVKP